MPSSDVMSEKKKALIAYKQQILQEIKYNEKRIDDARSEGKTDSFFETADSSDSEEEFCLNLDSGPSVSELRQEQMSLRTCQQATQELTSLQVLQSEVNILVDDPMFEGERPVTEPGVWREVTAECRVDLVPFSITFFVHQPDRKFGPPSYRGLRVAPTKAAHEGELNSSVLPTVTRPSDAVEVLRSFARAQRSRRSTLARLADKFANTLYMEPMPDGGYLLKCANLLEVSWTLQNKWSPIAPFHHRMKFDLEYMDESYIRTITQAHRQLSDPAIDTDERTLLLAKIISTCLEAQGPTQELYESMSSDPDASQSLRSRTTLDQAPARDHEVMAPPKSLPKRAKPKGKENMADNRKEKLKRANSDDNMNKNKKMKTNNEIQHHLQPSNVVDDDEEIIDTRQNKPVELKKGNPKEKTNIKNDEAKTTNNPDNVKNKNVASAKNTADNVESVKNVNEKTTKTKSNVANSKVSTKKVDSNKNVDKPKIAKEKSDLDKNVVKKNSGKTVDSENTIKPKIGKEKSNDKIKSVANAQKEPAKNPESSKKVVNKDGKEQRKDIAKKVAKEKGEAEKRQKANDGINNKGVKEKTNIEKCHQANSESSSNKKTNINAEKQLNTGMKKPKIADSESNTNNKTSKETAVTVKDNVKSVANTKVKETTKFKQVTEEKSAETKDEESTKVKEVARNKISSTKPKDNAGNTKTKESIKSKDVFDKKKIGKDKDASKKLPTENGKVTSAKTKIATVEKVANVQKSVVSVNNKTPPKYNKTNKTDKQTLEKDIERTVQKVVEKRQSAPKRKSNLVDRITNTDNVTSKKKASNNPETGEKAMIGSKNVAIKRKSNFADKDAENAKKRALNSHESVARKSENYQKATNAKFESKFKTKLMPGSIKTHAGNTNKVLSAGNVGSGQKTKIPKLSSVSEPSLKKNPLRISPRKIPSKFKTTIVGAKSIQKITSIPRLLKKPTTKT